MIRGDDSRFLSLHIFWDLLAFFKSAALFLVATLSTAALPVLALLDAPTPASMTREVGVAGD